KDEEAIWFFARPIDMKLKSKYSAEKYKNPERLLGPTLGELMEKDKDKKYWLSGMFENPEFLNFRMASILGAQMVYSAVGSGWRVSDGGWESLQDGRLDNYFKLRRIAWGEACEMDIEHAKKEGIYDGNYKCAMWQNILPLYDLDKKRKKGAIFFAATIDSSGKVVNGKGEGTMMYVPYVGIDLEDSGGDFAYPRITSKEDYVDFKEHLEMIFDSGSKDSKQ
ncbi:MAG: hypothetical protein WCK90_06130, partial [archaeon]